MPIEPTGVDSTSPSAARRFAAAFSKATCPAATCRSIWSSRRSISTALGYIRDAARTISDNCERFVFFCRAVLEAIRLLDLEVDVMHANDWQTGLMPAYLKIEYRGVPGYETDRQRC